MYRPHRPDGVFSIWWNRPIMFDDLFGVLRMLDRILVRVRRRFLQREPVHISRCEWLLAVVYDVADNSQGLCAGVMAPYVSM